MQAYGTRPNASCTGILIQDLCRLCVTLKEFGSYLKKIENYEALDALDWPNGMFVLQVSAYRKCVRAGTCCHKGMLPHRLVDC